MSTHENFCKGTLSLKQLVSCNVTPVTFEPVQHELLKSRLLSICIVKIPEKKDFIAPLGRRPYRGSTGDY